VNVRLIVATSMDLARAVQEGKFRPELYYRLAVVPIHLPALRERREDIPLLVDHFIRKYCEREAVEPKRLEAADLRRLMDAPWVGNVRELQNVIERAVVCSPGPVLHLKGAFPSLQKPTFPPPGGHTDRLVGPLKQATQTAQARLEQEQVVEALRQAEGNRSTAASLLGISRGTLYNKLKRYHLE
jgi:two-component system response regulator AtoC